MLIPELGLHIAKRQIILRLHGETDTPLVVTIGKPKRFPEGSGYYCPYQIAGAGSERVQYTAGTDAIQSLQLVMQIIGVDLSAIARQFNGEIEWLGASDMGFPH